MCITKAPSYECQKPTSIMTRILNAIDLIQIEKMTENKNVIF